MTKTFRKCPIVLRRNILFWSYHKHENAHHPTLLLKLIHCSLNEYVIWWWRRTYWKIKADIRVTLKRFNNMWFFGRQTTRVNLKRYAAYILVHERTIEIPLVETSGRLLGSLSLWWETKSLRYSDLLTTVPHLREEGMACMIIKSIPFILILFNRTRYLSHSPFSDLVNFKRYKGNEEAS